MTPVELFQSFKFVKVRFYNTSGRSPKDYLYKVPLDMVLEVDDLVLVPNTFEGAPYVVVVVMEVDAFPKVDRKTKYRWVVQKVDASAYEKMLELEEQAEQILFAAQAEAERVRLKDELLKMLPEGTSQKLLTMMGGQ